MPTDIEVEESLSDGDVAPGESLPSSVESDTEDKEPLSGAPEQEETRESQESGAGEEAPPSSREQAEKSISEHFPFDHELEDQDDLTAPKDGKGEEIEESQHGDIEAEEEEGPTFIPVQVG